MPRRALLSVSDKSGLPGFARGLSGLGFELYATGGTRTALDDAAIEVRPVSDLTGFPEILDGRVKTLHPGVHGGLLARRDLREHMRTLEEHHLAPIDLLCVNLYPFLATALRDGAKYDEVVEQIDVGGPAMVRSAAKNHAAVVVVVRPERYTEVLAGLARGEAPEALRRQLAAEAFAHTAAYDSQIAAWLRAQADPDGGAFPSEISLSGQLAQSLRYGENPHQRAAFYRLGPAPGALGGAQQLQGAELSFNNVQDSSAALDLVNEYSRPAAAIIKHMNPCGLAVAGSPLEAYRKAYACDSASAFGGVVALNRPLDLATAQEMVGIFLEVIIAPAVEPEARDLLSNKARLRLLEAGPPGVTLLDLDVRSLPGGLLVQTWDRAGFDRGGCKVASARQPTDREWEEMEFAWLAVKHVKSNAIVIARDLAAVGVGAGQMSRVEAVQIAARRAAGRAQGAVLASDAFFPFPDAVEEGIRAGVTAVIQPGGSVRDEEVVAAADAAAIAMVMTGRRHFRH
ncbi:MAG: bifunctional phosphoribosylaminoimidazolecarboxamide formyltransferase/IMP cyclohydrolase [Candidatus Dormibacteraceae bacterium]